MDSATDDIQLLQQFEICGYIYKSPLPADKTYLLLSCFECNEVFGELGTFMQHLDNHTTCCQEQGNIEKSAHQRLHKNVNKQKRKEGVPKDPLVTLSHMGNMDCNAAEDFKDSSNKTDQHQIVYDDYVENISYPLDNASHHGLAIRGEENENDINDKLFMDPLDNVSLHQFTTKGVEDKEVNVEDKELNVTNIKDPLASLSHYQSVIVENGRSIKANLRATEKLPLDVMPIQEGVTKLKEVPAEEKAPSQENMLNATSKGNIESSLETARTQEIKRRTNVSKHKSYIRALITLYKAQPKLWDEKRQLCDASKKSQALKQIAIALNRDFKFESNEDIVESTLKRLRRRFIQQYRLRKNHSDHDEVNASPSIWYYEQLQFIEPHIKETKQSTDIMHKLNDDQLLHAIELLKRNECFWNAKNLYHTSVLYRRQQYENMTKSFKELSKLSNLTASDMRSLIDNLISLATEDNKQRLKHLDSLNGDVYQSSNKFHREMQFLLPHVGPFKCKHCEKSFLDIYTYKFHISKHEGTKAFECMVCQRKLMHKKEFICHLRRHTNECPYKCHICDRTFPSHKDKQRHSIKHGSKPYVCEQCAHSFYTQHQLSNHMKNHNNIKDHICKQCGKGFTHRGLLRQHLQTHNRSECICQLCKNVYANRRSLRKHHVRIHQRSDEDSTSLHACKICLISFASLAEAKKHRKEHKQSLPATRKHICDICGHGFAYPRNLSDHKKTHANVRDQVCDVCGKAFTNINLLNQHRNVHNGQKFACKLCGKDYAHYRGLCRHISKVHNNEGKYANHKEAEAQVPMI